MRSHPFAAQPSLDVAGNTFDAASTAELVEVVVDTDLTAASSCTITFLDADRVALDGIDYGSPVKIKAPGLTDDTLVDLFEGEVYAMEFEADERGTYSRITAFDHSYRLKQHRLTKAHISVTDSDVVEEIAKSTGMKTGTVDATSVVHDHLGQINETHWDFLRERAAANDFEVFIEGGRLNFRKPNPAASGPKPAGHDSPDPLQLTPGKNLTHLRTRLTAAQQVGEVEVRGWDPTQKAKLVGTARAKSNSTKLAQTAADLAGKAGGTSRVTGRADFTTQAECDALAESIAQRTAATIAYAEGTAFGDPRLVAGVAVSIGEVGNFDGQYTLTRARHVFRPGDYRTSFTVSGNHDRTHFGLQRSSTRNDWVGTYPALVTNVADPEKLGVKLQFPWLDETYESSWARVMQIGAGENEGIQWYPEVGDEVIVSFLSGDPRRPVVLGGTFNGKDQPPFPDHLASSGEVDVRGMKSRAGHVLAFHDKGGEERIEIISSAGSCTIVLNEADKKIVIETGGEIVVKAAKNVEVEAQGDVNVTSSQNLKINASRNAEITAGANLKISAGAVVEIKGSLIKLN
jgi:phage protein D/phage baseplate assembly protein gpV